MSKSADDSLNKIDALLAAHLGKQMAHVDAAVGVERVRAGLDGSSPRPASRRRRTWLRLAIGGAVAAAVLIAFFGGRYVGPVQASARDLVEEAKLVHSQSLERCYLVEMRRIKSDEDDPSESGVPPRQVR